MGKRDPVEARADQSRDLYDISTWEPRTALDRLATRLYGGALLGGRVVVILVAALLTLAIAGEAFLDPVIGLLTLLSAVPALLLVGYVYYSDVTTNEPLGLLVATFILSVIFASFAAVINSSFSFLSALGFPLIFVFFYLVVGPVEETVKLLAVRLYAYRKPSFNAVIDGAVYGAVAGLGFATIENAIYIQQGLDPTGQSQALTITLQGLLAGTDITATRALAGPGHVVYSAFAGYYLGLAKFNPENAGPIVVKGLLIAAFIHATYNSLVGIVVGLAAIAVPSAPQLALFFGFVLVYQGLFGGLLLRKINRYRRAYRTVHAGEDDAVPVEPTEFDA
jgi:RsiW-degrading membrane proteinase PrsW (M82 family)